MPKGTESTTKFKADITDFKAAMQEAARAVRLANSEFKAASAGLGKWSDSADGLSAKLKQLDKVLDAQKRQLSVLDAEYAKVVKEQGESSKGAQELAIRINNQKAAIKNTESQLDKYSKQLEEVEKDSDDMGDALVDSAKDADKASEGFTVMKGALASLVADGIKLAIQGLKDLSREAMEAYKEFDTGRDNVIKATGATGKAADDLEKSYANVAKSIKGDFDEIGAAIGAVNTRFEFTGEQLETTTKDFIKFADINKTDVTTAIALVSRAMGDAGIENEKYGEVLDALTVASQKSGIAIDSLTEMLTKYGAPMRALGFDTKESIAIFSSWEKAGVNTSIAFSGMRKAISNWSKEGKDARKEFKKTLTDIKNTPSLAKATTKAIEVFGAKAGPDLADAIKEGRFEYEDFLKLLSDSKGAVADTYEETQSGYDKVQLKIQEARLEMAELVKQFVTKYQPEIEKFIKSAVDGFGDFLDAIGDLFKYLIDNGDTVLAILKGIAVAFVTYQAVATIMKVVDAFTTLFSAIKSGTSVVTALNGAMALNPYALAAAAIAGVVTALVAYNAESRKAQKELNAETKATKELIDENNDLQKSLEDSADARKDNVKNTQEEAVEVDILWKKIKQLNKIQEKSNAQKETMASLVDRLNELYPELNLAYDKEKDKLNKTNKQIEKNIELKKEQALADAMQANAKDVIADIAELTVQQEKLNEQQEKNKAKVEETREALKEANKAYQDYLQANYDGKLPDLRTTNDEKLKELYNNTLKLSNATYDASVTYDELQKSIDGNQKKLAELNDEYNRYETAAENIINKQDIAKQFKELSKIAKNEGVKIPKAVSEGIKSGKYSLPDSLKELKRLIKFEDAIKKAGLEGESIPKELSDGVIKGKVKVSEAVKQIKSTTKTELEKTTGVKKAGEKTGHAFVDGLNYMKNAAKEAGKDLAKEAKKGADEKDETTDSEASGSNFAEGFFNGMGTWIKSIFKRGKELAQEGHKGLKEGQKEGSPSKLTTQSGIYFGEGFNNGIKSMIKTVVKTAGKMGASAVTSLQESQEEGSPSKLTFKSGVNFVKGYINGIASMEKGLVKTVKGLVKGTVNELLKLNNFNFSEVQENASNLFSEAFTSKVDYLSDKMAYQNEKKLSDFDNTILSLEKKRDKKIEDLEKKRDKKKTAKEKQAVTKQINNTKSYYNRLIKTQNKYKNAYQTASSAMISEFNKALSDYQEKAQELIDTTIGGITEKYQARYDDLISKQDNLINKLKTAGDLFEISNAGVITVADINEQTKQIKTYAESLKKIKSKVSSDLFNQIAEYDMKEGQAFLNQLLGMSEAELKAYDTAYSEKMSLAESLSKDIYKSDFDKIESDYEKEIQKAFKNLPKQLEDLGVQAMKGFVNGLTSNTDYMDKNVKKFVKSMVSQFKKELKIKSPSKVMTGLGEYTGEGFGNGLINMVKYVKQAATSIADATTTSLAEVKGSVGDMKAAVGTTATGLPAGNLGGVVNNYNLVQNNNSPKALSALETYKARREQVAMVKALTQSV